MAEPIKINDGDEFVPTAPVDTLATTDVVEDYGLITKASVQLRHSKKTGNDYQAVILSFENGYEKMIFLERAEQFMVSALVK